MSGVAPAPEGITNPPIDELLERTSSKYGLVIFAAKRARRKHQYVEASAPAPPAANTRVAPMLASMTWALRPKPGSAPPPPRNASLATAA